MIIQWKTNKKFVFKDSIQDVVNDVNINEDLPKSPSKGKALTALNFQFIFK